MKIDISKLHIFFRIYIYTHVSPVFMKKCGSKLLHYINISFTCEV